MTGCIVGWAHTKFGKHDGRDVESLIVEVADGALADAGVAAADIDQVFLGTMNGGFVKQEFPASLGFQADPAFRFKPATRVENACATGSAGAPIRRHTISRGRLCSGPSLPFPPRRPAGARPPAPPARRRSIWGSPRSPPARRGSCS